MSIRHFSEIKAWEAARSLVAAVYALSKEGPLERDFGLRDQLRRAAVSVMSNIAEGFGRGTARDFIRFLDIAQASGNEVESLLYVIQDLRYADPSAIEDVRARAGRSIALIRAFRSYLNAQSVREQHVDYAFETVDEELRTQDGEPSAHD